MSVVLIVLRRRDFINVGVVQNMKSTLGGTKGDTRSIDYSLYGLRVSDLGSTTC